MDNLVVISPNGCKESAEALAQQLRIPFVLKESFPENSAPDINSKIINYGCSRIAEDNVIMNKPRCIRRSLNKLRTFELLSEHVRMPVMTLDKGIAMTWALEGRSVVVRNRVKGSRSQGITITNDQDEIFDLPAKFYTRLIENCIEVRINVYKGQVLTVYHKVVTNSNHFAFKIQRGAEESLPADIVNMVSKVGEYIGLDFYGMDVLLTPKGKYFLLEVNSAPVLFPITMKRLAKLIKQEHQNA